MASYNHQSELVGNASYRLRVRACLLEESATKPPGFDNVYVNIHLFEDRAVNRLSALHAGAYASGKVTGLAEPSNNVSDGDILSGVQTFWAEITNTTTAV